MLAKGHPVGKERRLEYTLTGKKAYKKIHQNVTTRCLWVITVNLIFIFIFILFSIIYLL